MTTNTIQPLSLENAVIFDTETTGVKLIDEIIELGIIDAVTGDVILQTLLKPSIPIPAEATAVHGITNEMVANAPTWLDIQVDVIKALYGKRAIAYNSEFDRRMILQTASKYKASEDLMEFYRTLEYPCAMKWYAEFYNEWNTYKGSYKWQKLTDAAFQQDVQIDDLDAHRASCDCEITRRVINAVNAQL